MTERKFGLIMLAGSLFFLLITLLKIIGQPLSSLLYSSRITVCLYLLFSLILGSIAFYFFYKNNDISQQSWKNNQK